MLLLWGQIAIHQRTVLTRMKCCTVRRCYGVNDGKCYTRERISPHELRYRRPSGIRRQAYVGSHANLLAMLYTDTFIIVYQ